MKRNTMVYKVYFELFGKKMSTKVVADNEQQAKEEIKSKLKFHKVKPLPTEWNEAEQMVKDLFKKMGL